MKFAVLIYTEDTLLDALPEGQFDAKMRDCLASRMPTSCGGKRAALKQP